jgi:hypothetical protein
MAFQEGRPKDGMRPILLSLIGGCRYWFCGDLMVMPFVLRAWFSSLSCACDFEVATFRGVELAMDFD